MIIRISAFSNPSFCAKKKTTQRGGLFLGIEGMNPSAREGKAGRRRRWRKKPGRFYRSRAIGGPERSSPAREWQKRQGGPNPSFCAKKKNHPSGGSFSWHREFEPERPRGKSGQAPPGAEEAWAVLPQPRHWRAGAHKPGPGMASAARWIKSLLLRQEKGLASASPFSMK